MPAIVLYQPEIAANVGNIGRTCVAVGAPLWLVRPLGFHLDDRNRRRAGLDYWEHLRLTVVDDIEEVAAAPGVGRLWLFTTRAGRCHTDADYRPDDALVFGPESRGLPARWIHDRAEQTVRIPMRPEARSLNLANAVAIGLYEAVRQLGGIGSPGAALDPAPQGRGPAGE